MLEKIYSQQRLRAIFWLLATVMGILQAWTGSTVMDSDGVSYLDIGDAYFRGDWHMALNAYWSPLYSWLLGLALAVLQPSPFWEFPVVHLVNVAIYLGALGCFDFFLRELMHYHQEQKAGRFGDGRVALPEWAWLVLGYPLFIWSSLFLINIQLVRPDMCVAAFVYVAFGLLLRIRTAPAGWLTFIFLGMVLGLGYLAKAALFPLAFVFLGVSMFSGGNRWRAVPRVLSALAVFLLIVSPFVTALSKAKGRLTFGDSAKLNYAWFVNLVPRYAHWQGEVPGSGTPKHPTRRIFDGVAIYEFRTPIKGTFPPWFDPSYWYEGITPYFNLKMQIRALILTSKTYLNLIGLNVHCILIVAFLMLVLYMGGRQWLSLGNIAEQWHFFTPGLTALLMYAFVHVEGRFVGAFITVLWLGAFSSVHLVASQESRKLVVCVSVATAIAMLIAISSLSVGTLYSGLLNLRTYGDGVYKHWKIADGLHRMGIKRGDEVAFIGDSNFGYAAYWARLARVRIIAEILPEDAPDFWRADDLVTFQAIKTFGRIGAKAIVAEKVSAWSAACDPTKGWQRIGTTNYCLLFPLTGREG